jgi:DNA polymerase-3 subunit gamma/tau
MGLYQKYRPKTFGEVHGNKALILSLKGMLKDLTTCPHSFLFHGQTGTGKTTLARIVARELGCTENNVIEIDTAQFRGIDTIRDLRNKAQYTPLGGGVRVYITDEIQSATSDAQNALLKILEDTPPHVYFILCTTDPQKLLPTIRGRCVQFQTQLLSDDEMVDLLTEVAVKEDDNVAEEVIEQIIIDSQGHPRNALTILEQVLATPTKQRLKIAKQSAAQQSESIALCRALIKGESWTKVSTILRGLKGQEPESIRRVVLGYATSVLLNKQNQKAGIILECFEEPTYAIGFPGIVLACFRTVNYE